MSTPNNLGGNLSRDAETGVARSCLGAPRNRANVLVKTPQNYTSGMVCHLAWPNLATWHSRATWHGRAVPLGCLATCGGLSGLVVLRGSGSVGLLFNAFSQLFSPSWHSFLLNVDHLSVSSMKFLKISKYII